MRLLDQELHKITEFYVDKERELLGDVVMLQADIERMEEDQSGLSGHGGGATSGGSDSEDGDADSDAGGDDTVAARFRRSMEGVFSNPRKYDAAARKGRTKRAGSSTSQGRARRRALSNASRASGDLVDLDEEAVVGDVPVVSGQASNPVIDGEIPVSQRPALGRVRSRRRETSSAGVAGDDDDDVYGRSDWAIDTQIMYKRRIAALFTVSVLVKSTVVFGTLTLAVIDSPVAL